MDSLNTSPPPRPRPLCIDVHHHIFPSASSKRAHNAHAAFPTPPSHLPWTPALSLSMMDALGIDVAVLSMPADALNAGPAGAENRRSARAANERMWRACVRARGRFGFWACLPVLSDTEGALAEIDYALDVLHANGIAITSSYGTGPDATYIADPSYDPIWAALNARRAPVFLHGAMTPSAAPHPHPTLLGLPVVAVPNETFKAAAALVMARKGPFAPLSPPPPPPPPPPPSSSPTSPTPTPTPADPDPDTAPPRARIVLSHLGGSAPSLIPRLAGFSTHLAALVPASSSPSEPAPPSAEEVFGAFGRDGPFWWETAGAGHAVGLGALRGVFVESEGEGEGGEGEGEMRGERGRVLFGTDFPALTLPTIEYFTTRLRAFYAHDADARALEGVMGGNASRLLGIDAEGAWWAERWGGVELDTEVEEEGGV